VAAGKKPLNAKDAKKGTKVAKKNSRSKGIWKLSGCLYFFSVRICARGRRA